MRGSVESYNTQAGKRYRIRFDLPPGADGQRRQRSRRGFTSKGEAERALRQALSASDVGSHVEVSRLTVGEYLFAWLEGHPVRETSRAAYRTSIRARLVPRLGGIRLQRLTTSDIDRAYRELERTGLSPKSVRMAHGVLRTSLQHAVERGLIPRNPAEHAHPPPLARPPIEVWDARQVGAFLRHVADDRLVACWMLLFTTGVRRGEALGLQWPDVDLDDGGVVVRRNVTTVDGRVVVGEPKTARGNRTLALDPATVDALRAWRRRQAEQRLAAGPAWRGEQPWTFTRPDGRHLHPNTTTARFRRLVKRAGLPPLTPHGARHTWATLALASGVPPKVVSDRLGHSTVSLTLDRYTHWVPALDRAAADTVAGAIFGLPEGL